MTEEQIKEAISKQFLRLIANTNGFKTSSASLDHGVDLTVIPVSRYTQPDGSVRYLDSSLKLDIQLKCTTEARLIDAGADVRFDLEAKTYNDLVHRRQDYLPLVLVLVVLSSAPPACISVDDLNLAVAGRGFWYLPDEGAAPTPNTESFRITIPKTRRLGLDFIQSCYAHLDLQP